ncbi:MAG TPA: YfiR family protein [Gemmatimonadales bacterium]|nr:YfiR family protein [Gemmatimonadales bacterium]
MNRPRWLLLAALLTGSARALAAQEMAVPVDVQIPLLYKILTFDRKLGARAAGDDIVIAILYQETFRTSVTARNQVQETTKRIGGTSILGHPVNWMWLELGQVTDLEAAFVKYGVDVIYVAPIRGVGLDRITTAARGKQVTSFTGVPEFVDRGIAVGIGLQRERAQILINLVAARAEGAEFGAQLLNLARVIETAP